MFGHPLIAIHRVEKQNQQNDKAIVFMDDLRTQQKIGKNIFEERHMKNRSKYCGQNAFWVKHIQFLGSLVHYTI